MNSPKFDIDRSVTSIRNKNFEESALKALSEIVANGNAAHLVEAIIESEEAAGRDAIDAVTETLQLLELLGDKDILLTCVFMAHLWPIGNDLFLHDVCNGIDLWIDDCDAPELITHLKLIASSENNSAIRRHYEQWIQSKSE